MTARRPKVLPTRSELRILNALWDLGQGTVEDVTRHHSFSRRPNYKTTQTLLRIMEQKGLVRHLLRGLLHVYRASHILATPANENTDSGHALLRFLRCAGR
jgi:predicted transcriptional regulator